MALLSSLKQGDSARIVGYQTQPPHTLHLQSLGLVPGTIVSILRVAPMGDPIHLKLRDYDLCLRREDLACISVAPIPP